MCQACAVDGGGQIADRRPWRRKLGIAGKVNAARSRASEVESNRLSVRLELKADCRAGGWVNPTQQRLQWLQEGDIEEAMRAPSATINSSDGSKATSSRRVFAHGSAQQQRIRWFTEGLRAGDIQTCATFFGGI